MSIQVTVQSIVSTTLAAGVLVIDPALHGELHQILLTYAHYITLLPNFINVLRFILLATFTICHEATRACKVIHYVIGGVANRRALKKTCSEESERLDDMKQPFQACRTNMLFLCISSNLFIAVYVVYFSSSSALNSRCLDVLATAYTSTLLICVMAYLTRFKYLWYRLLAGNLVNAA
ncbi:hypothetical protein CCR75_003474 [Bremia lactucae]|uniref:Uncharacterized protein n=1 Tax=Bremia lactucae TaxID=4779 RepID=A0A976FKP0_BRELC|nr:hypothetical protein CCR75_003474 [Bremia lactucae]